MKEFVGCFLSFQMMPEHERRLTLFLTVTFAIVGFLIKGFMYYQTLQEAERSTSMPTVVVAILSDRYNKLSYNRTNNIRL